MLEDNLGTSSALPASRATDCLENRSWFASLKVPGQTTRLPVTEFGATLQFLPPGLDLQKLRAWNPILTVLAFSLSAGKATKQGEI